MFKGYLRYIANRRAQQIGIRRSSRRKTRSVDERIRSEEGTFQTRVISINRAARCRGTDRNVDHDELKQHANERSGSVTHNSFFDAENSCDRFRLR
jgi:hypothetical protein